MRLTYTGERVLGIMRQRRAQGLLADSVVQQVLLAVEKFIAESKSAAPSFSDCKTGAGRRLEHVRR